MVARNKSKKINKNEYITFKYSKKINRNKKIAELEKQYGGFNWGREKWIQFKETPIFESFFKKKTLFAKYVVLYQRRINRHYEKFTNYNELLKIYIAKNNGKEVFPVLRNSNIITEKSLEFTDNRKKSERNEKIIKRNEKHKRRIYRNIFKNKYWDSHIRSDAYELKFYEPWGGTRSKLRKLIINLRKYETKFNRNYDMLKRKIREFGAEFSPQYRQYLDSISKTKLDKVSSDKVKSEKDKVKQEVKDIKNLDKKIRKIFDEANKFVETIKTKFNDMYPYYGFERLENYKIISEKNLKKIRADYDPFADIKSPRNNVNHKIKGIKETHNLIIQQLMKSNDDIDKINSNIDRIYSTQNQKNGLYLQYHKEMKEIVEKLAPNLKYIYYYDLGFPLVNIEQYKKFAGFKDFEYVPNSIDKRIGDGFDKGLKNESPGYDKYRSTFHFDKFMPMFMQKQVLKSIIDDEAKETYKQLIDNNDHKISYDFIGKYIENEGKDFILTNNLINCMYFFKQLNNYQDLLFGSIIFLTERYYYLFDLQNYLDGINEKEFEEEQIKKGVSKTYLKRLRAIHAVSRENIEFLLDELKFDIQYVYILYVKDFVGKMKSRIEQKEKISKSETIVENKNGDNYKGKESVHGFGSNISSKTGSLSNVGSNIYSENTFGGGKKYETNDNDTDEKDINELINVLKDFGSESIDELIKQGPIYQISTRLRKILKEELDYNSDMNLNKLIKNIIEDKNYDGDTPNRTSTDGGGGEPKSPNKEDQMDIRDFYVEYIKKELNALLRTKTENTDVDNMFMALGDNKYNYNQKFKTTLTNEGLNELNEGYKIKQGIKQITSPTENTTHPNNSASQIGTQKTPTNQQQNKKSETKSEKNNSKKNGKSKTNKKKIKFNLLRKEPYSNNKEEGTEQEPKPEQTNGKTERSNLTPKINSIQNKPFYHTQLGGGTKKRKRTIKKKRTRKHRMK